MKRLVTTFLLTALAHSAWAGGLAVKSLTDVWPRHADSITGVLGLLAVTLAGAAGILLRQNRRMRIDNKALKGAKQKIRASELFAKATFDAVSAHICVLDHTGKILIVNQAWRDFLDENQDEPGRGNYGIGTNYLNICESSVGPKSAEAIAMASGVRQVMSGACDEFVLEYPCHSPTQQRWFNAKVTRFPGESGNVVVAHETITAVKLAEQREQHRNRVLQMLTEKAPLASVLDVIAGDMEALQPGIQCRIQLAGHAAQELPLVRTHCISQPIISSHGKALGTLDVYLQQPNPPTPADLRVIVEEAQMAAMAVEKTEAETRLRLSASVFAHAREGIVITDANGTIIEVNDTFTLITGYSRDEVLGQNPRILNSGRQAPEFYTAMWAALIDSGHWVGEVWNRRKDATEYPELLSISAVLDANDKSQHYVALFTDITAMKEHAQQLEHIAHYDALTSLPNRVLLADRLQQAMILSQRQKRVLAVVVLDLDGFKAVNDAHGHNAGDELLIVLSQRMKAALRDGDTLARTGGDEFVAVLVDLELAQECEPVLMRLLQAIAAPVTLGDAVLRVSASMGVTLYPQDGVEADVLLRHADQAMYLAKQAGKNRYHRFDVAQDKAAKTQRESLVRIRRAMDEHEFVLYYQPKVNMKTGTVIGAEALIRWQHPERGLLAPAEFLPVIESEPISVELGEWVIDTALAQMTEWHAHGLVLGVSVNIGARQLQQGDFAARLAGLLAAHPAVEPRYLELEVLETSALQDMAQVSAVMFACSRMGVHFALDDFGTGYSSLTYLKRLPAEMLKIDQSFVRGMLDDPDDLAIVKGVIGLVAAFRRNVIAEGVETVAHGELLLSLGCELAQGYGIARPLPAQDFPNWVSTWRADASWEIWRGRSPSRDDQLLVFVEVEHRHWLRSIESFLAGDLAVPPTLDAHHCHFGRWQDTEGLIRFGHCAEFPALVALHDQVHILGRELVALRALGRQNEVPLQSKRMQMLRDELIVMLRHLVQPSDPV